MKSQNPCYLMNFDAKISDSCQTCKKILKYFRIFAYVGIHKYAYSNGKHA